MDYSKCMYMIPIFMKRLYEENGEIPIRCAVHFIRTNAPPNILNTDEDIKEWLNFNSAYFRLKNNGLVVGTTRATLCGKHCNEPGSCRGGCDKLHICRFFILTKDFRCPRECRFNHDLKNPHNDDILRRHHLQFLDVDQLRCLFSKPENRHRQTLPPICRDFNLNTCEKKNCHFLHLCKRFILDRCPLKKKCKLSHLIDGKVLSKLRDYAVYINQADIPEGLQKLRRMYSEFERLPDTGLLKATSVSDIRRTSIGAESRIETVDHKRLFPSQSLMNLSATGRGRQQKRGYQKKDNDKTKPSETTTNICMNFLSLKYCANTDCKHHHRESPYKWQYKIDFEVIDWKDFDPSTNEELEEKYCNPINECHVTSRNGFIKYNFENMTMTNQKSKGSLRRLSTPSSAVRDQNANWTTVWLWYFETDLEEWMEYMRGTSKSPLLRSLDIEEKYLNNREGRLHFIHEGMCGFIDFKEMFQMHKGKRAIRRRPKPFQNRPWTNGDHIRNQRNFDIFSSSRNKLLKPSSPYPSNLNLSQDRFQEDNTSRTPLLDLERKSNSTPEAKTVRRRNKSGNRQKNANKKNDEKPNEMEDFKIIDLDKNDPEFRNVSKKFNETMEAKGATLTSIEAIQNAELSEEYERRKTKMTKKLGNPSSINEMDLFHGTEIKNISVISKRGFDARLSEEAISTRFGKGSYFMKKADYAHKYISSADGIYKMLLAKVLTGRSCKGKMTYIRPPLIDPDNLDGDLYDSCCDDDEKTNVFVIFSNDQMLPAYIITYEADF